jgi:hypothetical protein
VDDLDAHHDEQERQDGDCNHEGFEHGFPNS